jgi:hypothetical protein
VKTEEVKTAAATINELSESYVDLLQAISDTKGEVKATKKLWRDGNKSRLIKLGLALIVFPEPTPISETVGAFLVAAGAVQKGIRRRNLYVEDLFKTFQTTLKEVRETKQQF